MITPNQIREKKISTAENGYDRNEVNELLVEIIDSYEAVCAENKELYRKMEILANKIEEYRADEDSIKTALISAQKMAHQVTSEAKEKAEQTISQSTASAQQTVQDAREKADKIIGDAREYVANLTKEKTQAADEIIAEAQEKANNAISSAKLVAQDTIEKAKNLTQEIVEKAKSEKGVQQEIATKLKAESKEFKTTLVTLYEAQLTKLKGIVKSGDDGTTVEDLENELDAIISNIEEISNQNEIEIESVEQEETADVEDVQDAVDEPEETDDIEEIDEIEDVEEIEEEAEELPNINDVDEVDEIINEIEQNQPEFDLVDADEEDSKPPTKEEVASALNAFTDNEITPVEETGGTIPVISEEAELETPMPFENYFNVDKVDTNTDETISLKAPDEDDESDNSKFKGFFRKKK
jgi:cell division septum initiation protein DivIVA